MYGRSSPKCQAGDTLCNSCHTDVLLSGLSLVQAGSISTIINSILSTSVPAIFPASPLRVKVQCQNRILGKVDQWFYCSSNILPI